VLHFTPKTEAEFDILIETKKNEFGTGHHETTT
jgi:hypothetical protein